MITYSDFIQIKSCYSFFEPTLSKNKRNVLYPMGIGRLNYLYAENF